MNPFTRYEGVSFASVETLFVECRDTFSFIPLQVSRHFFCRECRDNSFASVETLFLLFLASVLFLYFLK